MRKRDIGILIGLGVVVLLVAWYFLLIGPKRDNIATANENLKVEKDKYDTNSNKIKRIEQERDIAEQATADLLKLDKLMPIDEQVPSLIVELQQSARDSGIVFTSIIPGTPVASQDGSGTVVPFELKFDGKFYDINDFLYRVENYARMEGSDVNVSGRFISVVALEMDESEERDFPYLSATLSINAFMTSPPPPTKTQSKKAEETKTEGATGGAQ